jgi:hypothetical protein
MDVESFAHYAEEKIKKHIKKDKKRAIKTP